MIDKHALRLKIKAGKALLDDAERLSAAEAVFAAVEQSAAFMMAENVLMYHSLPDEISTREFIDRWHTRKHFYLPRVNGVNLEILPYDRSRMHIGAFCIEEPTGDDVVDVDKIDLMVVPAVAYDRHGNRLGRGKGFYDRLLCEARATTMGVAYDFQLVDEVPAEEHDVAVHYVVTPSAFIKTKHSSGR